MIDPSEKDTAKKGQEDLREDHNGLEIVLWKGHFYSENTFI